VHQLDIKVLDIVDARCNHEVIDMFLRGMYALQSWNVPVKATVSYPTLSIQDE